MAELRFYADAAALIGLARIGRLDLLALLPTPVYATTRVWAEVTGDPTKPGVAALQQACSAGLVAVVDEGDPAAALIDERRARACIEQQPELRGAIVEVTGIIGLVLLAKARGHIAAVRPVLDDLVGQSFRISPVLH